MKKYDSHFSPAAAESLIRAIREAGGQEVFARGILGDDGLICDIEVLARGNEHCVAAIFPKLKGGDYAIHNHPPTPGIATLDNIQPSDADVSIASQLGQRGVGSMIVDNEVEHSYVLVETSLAEKPVPVPLKAVENLLLPDGPLSRIFKNYETRPEQLTMLRTVTNAFNEGSVSVVEAGTGTGKTIAYLIPAIAWALLNNKRVVIATHTINLQEQLFLKDFPLAAKLFKANPEAALIKGRSNFACLRRANQVFREPELFEDEERPGLQALAQWAMKSSTGDRQEPAEWPPSQLWEQICSSRETCVNASCRFNGECFVKKARKGAENAQIIITNHALLFSDIAIRAAGNPVGILPDYAAIIIDEAHNLEDSATSHFGMEVTKFDILRNLNSIYQKKGHKESGALFVLRKFIEDNKDRFRDVYEELSEGYNKLVEHGLPALAEEALGECNDIHSAVMKIEAKARLEGKSALPLRLKRERREGADWEEISDHMKRLEGALTAGALLFNNIFSWLENKIMDDLVKDDLPGIIRDLKVKVDRFDAFAAVLNEIRTKYDEDSGMVSWIDAGETKKKSIRWLTIKSVPVTVGEKLKELVYKQFKTVVLTSATLSIRDKMDFYSSRTGLDLYSEELKETRERSMTFDIYPSSFDFTKQAALLLPWDDKDASQDYSENSLNPCILKIASLTEGGAFVLFTSAKTMQLSYNDLEPQLRRAGMIPMLQDNVSRTELLSKFKQNKNAVLFGLDSFWAGVDVAGEGLRNVIVTKLPFAVPTDPVQEARCEELEARGISAFPHYSLPQAVIKLRQGFGRLIRSKQDHGIVAILDSRILRMRYGKIFLESLPQCPRILGSLEEVCAAADKFLKSLK
ncbi:DEAD/DEAH box helicase family protein [bacterium]|nr:DEAD/DEAH box helicase family protein [bacterium]